MALGESTLNLTLVMAWIVLPIYAIPDAALEQGVVSVPYTPAQVLLNGGLAGAFFLLGFYQAQNVILMRFPWLGGPRRGGPRTS